MNEPKPGTWAEFRLLLKGARLLSEDAARGEEPGSPLQDLADTIEDACILADKLGLHLLGEAA